MPLYDIKFVIKFIRTNSDIAESDPSIDELDTYLRQSKIIPENSIYLNITIIDNVKYIGNNTFNLTCNSQLTSDELASEYLEQSLPDTEWESAPGNGSFVYPTKNIPNEELGLLSYSSITINNVYYKGY